MLIRELDGYFSEPTTARRALAAARGAREKLGVVDPFARGERPNQQQASRRVTDIDDNNAPQAHFIFLLIPPIFYASSLQQ